MEKITCYRALAECEARTSNGKVERDYLILAVFKSRLDAECAAKLYHIAFNNTLGKVSDKKCTGVCRVESIEYPKEYVKNAHILSVHDFINQNSVIKGYSAEVGNDAIEKLLKEIGFETAEEKELRIIESLIKDYKNKLGFALRASGISDKTIAEFKENVEYLESVRDEKSSLMNK